MLRTRIIKLVSFLLAASMVLATAACSKTDDKGGAETTGGAATEAATTAEPTDPRQAISDELPDAKYDGADWVLFGREAQEEEYFCEPTGDYVDDAIAKKNTTVEERFEVKLKMDTMDGTWNNYNGYMSHLTSIAMSGDGTYSLVEGDTYITDLMGNNYFRNWNDFDYINYDKPWWSQASRETMDIGGSLEFICGDYSIRLYMGLVVLYFNKQLAADKNVGDLYGLVKDKKWTIEKVANISADIKEDLNGDSKFNENDLYGLVMGDGNVIDNFIVSSDVKMVQNDDEGFPVFTYNTERAAQMAERVFNLTQADGVFVYPEGKTTELAEPMFMNNQALLFAGLLDSASAFRQMDTDFGIIPYPLFDESQEMYKTFSKSGFPAFAIPQTAKDPDMAAVITTALMAESYKQVVPAYYEITLQTKSTRDDESQAMLDIIREGFDFDIAMVLLDQTGYCMTMLRDMVASKTFKFSSMIASKEKTATKKLEKLRENILDNQAKNG